MTHKKLDSWDEFSPAIREIREKYGAYSYEMPDGSEYPMKNRVHFRGESNSEWELQTTLERKSSKRFDVYGYWLEADRCVNELESFTGRRWETKANREVEEEIKDKQDSTIPYLPHYDYLVYLRHYGFPSPLLDWTRSPYIAAYFAYCESHKSDRVALYAYVEMPTGGKSHWGGAPIITPLGHYTTTDARHFAQQACYTVATAWSKDERKHYFCPHAEVFRKNVPDQDVLVKITLPRTERVAALRDLNDHNINHFTLFQTEDSLVKAMAMKQFDIEPA